MDMQTTISAVAIGLITLICLVISISSFRCRGPLINNSWLWASAAEKAKMDKRPYYLQSAVIFALLTGVFGAMLLNLLTGRVFWTGVSIGITFVAIVCAISSEIRIRRDMRG